MQGPSQANRPKDGEAAHSTGDALPCVQSPLPRSMGTASQNDSPLVEIHMPNRETASPDQITGDAYRKVANKVVSIWQSLDNPNTRPSYEEFQQELKQSAPEPLSEKQESSLQEILADEELTARSLTHSQVFSDIRSQIPFYDLEYLLTGKPVNLIMNIPEAYPLCELRTGEALAQYCERLYRNYAGFPAKNLRTKDICAELARSGSMPHEYEMAVIYLTCHKENLHNPLVKRMCRIFDTTAIALGSGAYLFGGSFSQICAGIAAPLLASFLLHQRCRNAGPMVEAYVCSIAEQSLLTKSNMNLFPQPHSQQSEAERRFLGMQLLGLLPAQGMPLWKNARKTQEIAETHGGLERADEALLHACTARLEEYGLHDRLKLSKRSVLKSPLLPKFVLDLWQERERLRMKFQRNIALTMREGLG